MTGESYGPWARIILTETLSGSDGWASAGNTLGNVMGQARVEAALATEYMVVPMEFGRQFLNSWDVAGSTEREKWKGKEKEQGQGHGIVGEQNNNTGGLGVKWEGKDEFKRKQKTKSSD